MARRLTADLLTCALLIYSRTRLPTHLPAGEVEGLQAVVAHVSHPDAPPCHRQAARLIEGTRLCPGAAEGKAQRAIRREGGDAMVPRVGHVHHAVRAACEAVRPAQHGRRTLGPRGEATRGHTVQVEDLHLVSTSNHRGHRHSKYRRSTHVTCYMHMYMCMHMCMNMNMKHEHEHEHDMHMHVGGLRRGNGTRVETHE